MSAFETVSIDDAIAYARTVAEPAVREQLVFWLEDYRDGFADEGELTVLLARSNVTITGDFLVRDQPVLIDGDLSVDGQLTDNIETDYSLLLVSGSIRCREMWTLCCTYVGGDLEVSGVYYGASLHDHWTLVRRNLRAQVVIVNGHSVDAGGLSAAVRYGPIRVAGAALPESRSTEPFIEQVLDADGFDEDALYEHLARGTRILRG